MFYYCGPVAHAGIEGVAHTLKKNLEYEEAENFTASAVFSVFIEQMQNVLNYSAERLPQDEPDQNGISIGVMVIGHEENGYYILCGNRVYNVDIPRLRSKLETIQGMSKEELKNLYKERRRMEPESESKGAGLGLIEMARKGKRPMEYRFVPIDDEFSFYSIKVVVGR